ncbi:hypothetical protein [Providencia burhodogranariea]|uniref:Uncharacterized protein n=1 Tax=Providencia burhodogranariea DSM 19968 TaxID=1141662 RepID=K8X4M4_9GAMM|nr:hypothetical protein [Providencia burhodogranariea]EKT64632.1 hypothetical protein OOA_02507 [Providencia burhodogranariea DSM 19968]
MNKILEGSLNVASAVSEDTLDFQEIYSELTNQLSNDDELLNENVNVDDDNTITDEELSDIIMQYTITSNTIVMLKQHTETMKELLDE